MFKYQNDNNRNSSALTTKIRSYLVSDSDLNTPQFGRSSKVGNHSSSAVTAKVRSRVVSDSDLNASPKLNKGSNVNSVQVTSPKARVGGRSQSEWADQWWKHVMETPSSFNPLSSDQKFPQFGSVQFLAGVGTSGQADRSITISTGTHLFAPLANVVADSYVEPLGVDSTKWTVRNSREVARALTDSITDGFFNLVSSKAEISLISNWKDYRQSSKPSGFTYTSAQENVFGYPAGRTFTDAWQDGYYVMLNPLAPGNYQFRFGATFDLSKVVVDQNGNGKIDTLGEEYLQKFLAQFPDNGKDTRFPQDIKYTVTVVPQSKLLHAK